ncbi:unnamed protein product, partial [Rotaria sp. Silwood2]
MEVGLKKSIGKKCRNLYGKAIDVFASKRNLSKMKNAQPNKVTKDNREEDTASSASSSDQSSTPLDELNDKICRSYTLTNTCPTDSALFALYFIYKIDINIAGELNDAPETSAYSTLVKTFRTVEKEGWDAARLSWLHEHGILQHVAEKKSLFGSADKQVFRFLTREQQHSSQIECSRVQCKKRRRNRTNTELCL